MKNKEKFAEELSNIPFDELAMTMDGRICRCTDIVCCDCFFDCGNYPNLQLECASNFEHWLESETELNNEAEPKEPTNNELKAELERVKKERDEYKFRAEIMESALYYACYDKARSYCPNAEWREVAKEYKCDYIQQAKRDSKN